MLFSEASGRKVVSTTTAETVGKVDDYVIDPSGPLVAAVKVKKADGDTLRWGDILAFGTDAVTVESAEKITKGVDDELAPLLEKRNHLHKKLVLSTTGDALGAVRDIDFDPATGRVVTLVLDQGDIDATRLVGVGSYAVVVEADTPPPPGSMPAAPAAAADHASAGSPPAPGGSARDGSAPDESTPDESTPDESAPDESTPDESTPDESARDESARDESARDENGPMPIEYMPVPVESAPTAPATAASIEAFEPPPAESPTSLDLTEPGLVLEPPDFSQARRASYPPGE